MPLTAIDCRWVPAGAVLEMVGRQSSPVIAAAEGLPQKATKDTKKTRTKGFPETAVRSRIKLTIKSAIRITIKITIKTLKGHPHPWGSGAATLATTA